MGARHVLRAPTEWTTAGCPASKRRFVVVVTIGWHRSRTISRSHASRARPASESKNLRGRRHDPRGRSTERTGRTATDAAIANPARTGSADLSRAATPAGSTWRAIGLADGQDWVADCRTAPLPDTTPVAARENAARAVPPARRALRRGVSTSSRGHASREYASGHWSSRLPKCCSSSGRCDQVECPCAASRGERVSAARP